ncbi:MAG: hypothetical protein EZS28_036278 [Streblomastix strix]|uniref:Uncharacterized protein n=1 Tax=Streblomastix strix TaxID=222440 RepID=A0A5J4UF00_9EUKA|nr:MAG: hypothetical protein EZS28_036278 [Streblomastix strix]
MSANRIIRISNREICGRNVLNGISSYGVQANTSNQSLDIFVIVFHGKTDGGTGIEGRVSCYLIITLST